MNSPYFAIQKELCCKPGVEAGFWRGQTIFTAFCLRDVAQKSLDTFSLGLVVAAQRVMELRSEQSIISAFWTFTREILSDWSFPLSLEVLQYGCLPQGSSNVGKSCSFPRTTSVSSLQQLKLMLKDKVAWYSISS